MSLSLFALLALMLHLAGVLTAMHAVVHTRTPQGAIGWALGLILLPYVTLVPYFYLGASRFSGYLQQHRSLLRQNTCSPLSNPSRLRFSAMEAMMQRPFKNGHQLRLLIDGEQTFEIMLEAISQAEKSLLVQFFIINNDQIGRRLQQILLQRASAGVQVRVLYDGVGSRDLPPAYLDTLRQGGVAIRAFATQRWRNRFQLNFRNHRKIVVVDGKQAFIGGLNVGDEYLGLKPPLAPWRDTHLELRGPAIGDLQQLFSDDWEWTTGQRPERVPPEPCDGNAELLIVSSGPADPVETASLFFTAAIHAAQHRLWLSTPYFVPDSAVRAALQLAVLRGVDVRVLIPARPDHRTVFLASTLHAYQAVRVGIGIYRYQPGFLHQKALLIDDDTSSIGSMNLDSRSFRLNFEVNALVVDVTFASEVEAMLKKDFAQALKINEREYRDAPYLRRVAMHVARLFDPLL